MAVVRCCSSSAAVAVIPGTTAWGHIGGVIRRVRGEEHMCEPLFVCGPEGWGVCQMFPERSYATLGSFGLSMSCRRRSLSLRRR